MNRFRRGLLELWAMFVLAVAVGFLGPFGTYHNDPFVYRVSVWFLLLMGAYLLVRPLMLILDMVANATSLPARPLRFWGAVVATAPVAALWSIIGEDTLRAEEGYLLLVSFALLCGLAVFAVTEWAGWADRRVRARLSVAEVDVSKFQESAPPELRDDRDTEEGTSQASDPPLRARLSPAFVSPIVALQSEDHYVRVYGANSSELLLMRLQDAIAEMGNVRGERVHRSWWVALSGVEAFGRSGRAWVVRIAGGKRVPVARASVERLQKSGFLPDVPRKDCVGRVET
ncbi:LytTR family DNA-binding domain-containing protein [Novosphingobium sp. M1R2S20]|uniref:LytTR family DNA-binding domain-containing protein n=1 Tax=Novosphingobium rhizovicinum TaxID=3228928 RepID=A0ABV3RES1_9SPHN